MLIVVANPRLWSSMQSTVGKRHLASSIGQERLKPKQAGATVVLPRPELFQRAWRA
jgi:hypothetical protein